MQHQTINLTDHFPALKSDATLISYLPDNCPEVDLNMKRPTLIVCPGGCYAYTSHREAEPVALSFAGENYNVFVLRYSVAPQRAPQSLLELSAAVAYVRKHAEEFHVDEDAIIVCGFSAGGHLCASYGAFWDEPFAYEPLGIQKGANKPNGMILGYPVITMGKYAHEGSVVNLLGENALEQELERMSIEKQVSSKTPPAFIWHTFNDAVVPVQNALMLSSALAEHQVPFELHIFPDGEHGLAMCDKSTRLVNDHCKQWIGLCKKWLKQNFGK